MAEAMIERNPEQDKVAAGRSRAVGEPNLPDKVHTWPYLVRAEFIAGLCMVLALMVWALCVDAPLEDPANPTHTPLVEKAPWYFVGLQEMLVYFDPWIAGVVVPTLILVGLMLIPYVDINPNGNGYYTFRERPFAVAYFLFSFIGMWLTFITIGIFFRGPGWNVFWPWQYWDPQKVVADTNRNWNVLFGVHSYGGAVLLGVATLGAYFSLAPAFYMKFKDRDWMKQLGVVRYMIVANLILCQGGIVIKVLLRHLLNVKYILVTPWFNI